MIKIRFAAACCVAAGFVAVAGPAQADPVTTASAAASRPAVASQQPQARQESRDDEERLLCARIELPARRVRPRICRTRDQWENMGGVPADAR